MSNVDFSSLNTIDGLKAFLGAYHDALKDEKNFPPLGLQKALHTAAHVFGHKNWQVMSAVAGGVKTEDRPHCNDVSVVGGDSDSAHLSSLSYKSADWLVENILAPKGTAIFGGSGAGKSVLVRQALLAAKPTDIVIHFGIAYEQREFAPLFERNGIIAHFIDLEFARYHNNGINEILSRVNLVVSNSKEKSRIFFVFDYYTSFESTRVLNGLRERYDSNEAIVWVITEQNMLNPYTAKPLDCVSRYVSFGGLHVSPMAGDVFFGLSKDYADVNKNLADLKVRSPQKRWCVAMEDDDVFYVEIPDWKEASFLRANWYTF